MRDDVPCYRVTEASVCWPHPEPQSAPGPGFPQQSGHLQSPQIVQDYNNITDENIHHLQSLLLSHQPHPSRPVLPKDFERLLICCDDN